MSGGGGNWADGNCNYRSQALDISHSSRATGALPSSWGHMAQPCHIMSRKKSCHCYSTVHVTPSASICRNLAFSGLGLNHPICPESSHGARGFEVRESWGTAEGKISSVTLCSQTVSPLTLPQPCLFLAGMIALERGREPTHRKITVEGVRRTAIYAVGQDRSHSSAHTGMSVYGPETHAFTAAGPELLGRLIRLCQNPEFLLRWSLYVLS